MRKACAGSPTRSSSPPRLSSSKDPLRAYATQLRLAVPASVKSRRPSLVQPTNETFRSAGAKLVAGLSNGADSSNSVSDDTFRAFIVRCTNTSVDGRVGSQVESLGPSGTLVLIQSPSVSLTVNGVAAE